MRSDVGQVGTMRRARLRNWNKQIAVKRVAGRVVGHLFVAGRLSLRDQAQSLCHPFRVGIALLRFSSSGVTDLAIFGFLSGIIGSAANTAAFSWRVRRSN